MTGVAHAVGSWIVNQLYHAGFIVSHLANAQYHTSAILSRCKTGCGDVRKGVGAGLCSPHADGHGPGKVVEAPDMMLRPRCSNQWTGEDRVVGMLPDIDPVP